MAALRTQLAHRDKQLQALEDRLARSEQPEGSASTPESASPPAAAPIQAQMQRSYTVDSLSFKDQLGLQQKRKAVIIVDNMKKDNFEWQLVEGVCQALFIDQSMANMKIPWAVCDRNNKGKLDLVDFKNALPTIGERIPPDEVDLLFGMADEVPSVCLILLC